MSNASLKEQLQAVAGQLTDKPLNANTQQQATAPHSAKPQAKPKATHRPPAKTERPANKPKPKWLDYAQYGVELLKVYFPACFKKNGPVQPLKKGIKQDLIMRLSTLEIVTVDKACMVKSLSYYVNTVAYHKAVVVGAVRVDLDGNPAGEVTLEEANYSNERQQAKLQARQQAKQKEETVIA